MTSTPLPRRLAALLLHSALFIVPPGSREWGLAMLAELPHVAGNWSAFFWSLGASRLLFLQALRALVFHPLQYLFPRHPLSATKAPLRKPLALASLALLSSLLLLSLVPSFRAAFSLSFLQWHALLPRDEFTSSAPSRQWTSLERTAFAQNDAEALAFLSSTAPDASRAARLADEAVRRDPSLTWLYATVAVQWSEFPELDRWLPLLQRYDPRNALIPLIAAERADIRSIERGRSPHSPGRDADEWNSAMAAAFAAPRLETYSMQIAALSHRVLQRYHVTDPSLVLGALNPERLPSYAVADADDYAQSLLVEADALAARGDAPAAAARYASILQFSQLLENLDPLWEIRAQALASDRLAALSARAGDPRQAEIYASLAASSSPAAATVRQPQPRSDSADLVWSDSFFTRLAGNLLQLSVLALLIALAVYLLRSLASRPRRWRPGSPALALSLLLCSLAAVSAALLEFLYHPYANLVRDYLRTGDPSALPRLRTFLDSVSIPLAADPRLAPHWLHSSFAFYFWFAVTLLCTLSLLLSLSRYRHSHPIPSPPPLDPKPPQHLT